MTKKFTEEQYQKIVDCFDEENKEYNMGVMNPNLLIKVQDELFGEFDFINDWEEIFAIANPITRDWAHEQFVEKEKKYYWVSKKANEDGYYVHIFRDRTDRPVSFYSAKCHPIGYPFTEAEVKLACFNINMFDKEEVE